MRARGRSVLYALCHDVGMHSMPPPPHTRGRAAGTARLVRVCVWRAVLRGVVHVGPFAGGVRVREGAWELPITAPLPPTQWPP